MASKSLKAVELQVAIEDQCPEQKLDTAGLQGLLAKKYEGDGFCLFFDVPDNVGVEGKRRADAIAVGMWKSHGHLVEGFELKVSRADWLRELKQVHKADPFMRRVDRWWLVTADASIAKAEEIPEYWGWMVATKSGIRVQRPAQDLPNFGKDIDRLFAFALFKKARQAITDGVELRMDKARIDEEVARRLEIQVSNKVISLQSQIDRLEKVRETINEFERVSGIKLGDWRFGNVGEFAKWYAEMTGGRHSSMKAQLKKIMDIHREGIEKIAAVMDVMEEFPQERPG